MTYDLTSRRAILAALTTSCHDVHIHSTASDGTSDPLAIGRETEALGLDLIALTDHDTIDGVRPLLAWAQSQSHVSFSILPGVELSTDFDGHDVHLLGYVPPASLEALDTHLIAWRRSRQARNDAILHRLSALGHRLSDQDLKDLKARPSFGRPHIASCLVRMGVVSSVDEAMRTLLGRGGAAYVERRRVPLGEALNVIHALDGVAVVAHAHEYGWLAGADQNVVPPRAVDRVAQLAALGLDGLEVKHSDTSHQDERHLLALADAFDLVATRGSDAHGAITPLRPRYTRDTPAFSTKRLVVVCACLIRDGALLFGRRAAGKEHAGFWELPGGKCESGEAHDEALIRELHEELGLAATIGRRRALFWLDEADRFVTLIAYDAEGDVRTIRRAHDVHDELAWLTPCEALNRPILPADRALIEALRDRL